MSSQFNEGVIRMTTFHTDQKLVPTRLGRLHVRLVGQGEPLVLWHSMFVDSTSWDRIVPELARHRRLILVDGPSSGGSDPLDRAHDIAACAGAAEDLLAELRADLGNGTVGDQGIDWLGNAWGGHVGLHLAATRPDLMRTLVAVSAPTHPIGPMLRSKVRMLLPLYRAFGASGVVGSTITESLLTDHTRRHDPAGLELVLGPLRAADRRAMSRAVHTAILRRTDLGWAATRITAPVLFVTTDDRGEWTPAQAQAVAAQMTNAHEATVTGSRVIPAIEQPEQLLDILMAFWNRETAP